MFPKLGFEHLRNAKYVMGKISVASVADVLSEVYSISPGCHDKKPAVKLSPPDFDCAQLIVVGDFMLEWYWHGPTSRISPEALAAPSQCSHRLACWSDI
jgi:hypothetical protein